jgi:Domain of unknown function (DUF4136)
MRLRVLVPIAFVLLATIAYAQKVTFDSNPSAPFASYKTYAWTQGTPASETLMEQRIHAGVAAQLAAKGLMPTDAAPDLFVATHAVTQDHPQLVVNGFGWGLGGTASVENYTVGTLVVDLYDAKTRQMVWRGVATDSVSDKPQKNTERINKALEKMFAKYPGV